MNETRPVAVAHDAEYYKNRRVLPAASEPTGEPARQIEAPKIRHYSGPHRPLAAPAPAHAIRVSREEIERALEKSFTYHPNQQEIVDRIVLETARMDGFAEGSPPFREHHETILRLLREIGLYPV